MPINGFIYSIHVPALASEDALATGKYVHVFVRPQEMTKAVRIPDKMREAFARVQSDS